ncbi:TPA: ABC transporter permease, partial [Escherichia coli]|nr:ABC transporter permease [Escherichia coli]
MARSGFEVQKAAVHALFLRELRTRFGKYRLGYLWAVLEPAAHLLIMLAIFGFFM